MATGTKERILDAAERLFGERGFASTSLRDITAGAGVNVASVNYHFGSKEALLEAVLERRFRPINKERLAMLDAVNARAGEDPPPIEEVVRAFLLPPFERQRAWSADAQVSFLRLVGRIHAETNEAFRAMLVEQFDEVRQRFQAALQHALPDHPDMNWRMLFMIGSMSFTMSWGPMLIGREDAGHVPENVLESLVRYTAAGMTAASSHAAAPARVVAGAGARR
ncbi:MAG: TetR/AcrR family transcriptional regulator [Acidobacteria bacterium]|nr:TetR/AcrR family transcriptional regulator [Acidobacteriota bacterium]